MQVLHQLVDNHTNKAQGIKDQATHQQAINREVTGTNRDKAIMGTSLVQALVISKPHSKEQISHHHLQIKQKNQHQKKLLHLIKDINRQETVTAINSLLQDTSRQKALKAIHRQEIISPRAVVDTKLLQLQVIQVTSRHQELLVTNQHHQ